MAELPPVLVLYNTPHSGGPDAPAHLESEAGVLAEVQAVQQALVALSVPHRIRGIATLDELPSALSAGEEAVVFNLVEGFQRNAEQANLVPAVAAAFGRGCTGNPTECLALALDKGRSKAVLSAAGLPVPAGIIVEPGRQLKSADLPAGAVIVKPMRTDASEGIHADGSIFEGFSPALSAAVERIHQQFAQPAIVEQLVGSRELNVSVMERNGSPEVLGIAEIDFSAFAAGQPKIVDYAAKWLSDSFAYHHTPRILPAPLTKPLARNIEQLALAAWRALGCRDYARVDLRIDDAGNAWILEVNPNPDIAPDAGFAAAVAAAGMRYEDFVANCVRNAASQRTAAVATRRAAGQGKFQRSAITLRRTVAADRDDIVALIEATGFFRPGEVVIATEVLDESIAAGASGHYQSYTAELDHKAVGWVCFGPTPCTVGTYDLYWIAVSPTVQGKGVGAALMHLSEELIAERGGRRVIVETAGRADYEPTRQFYIKLHYIEAARVADFYDVGDDKVVYVKRV